MHYSVRVYHGLAPQGAGRIGHAIAADPLSSIGDRLVAWQGDFSSRGLSDIFEFHVLK